MNVNPFTYAFIFVYSNIISDKIGFVIIFLFIIYVFPTGHESDFSPLAFTDTPCPNICLRKIKKLPIDSLFI